jgi:hypothetical protein
MSRPNVDALAEILRSLQLTPLAQHELGPWIPQLAEALASRGVLAVSALTEADLVAVSTSITWFPEMAAYMRSALARIAREGA